MPGRPLLVAAGLFALVIAIGLLKPTVPILWADGLAIRIAARLHAAPGADWITHACEWLDRLGEPGGRLFIALILGLYLARAGRAAAMLWLFAATLSSALVNPLLKAMFAIGRPDVAGRLVEAGGYSFPSGHAAGAMTLFGAIALLFPARGVACLCLLMVLATGFSRVWLAVHWPSDVLGGWIEGMALLLILRHLFPQGLASAPSQHAKLAEPDSAPE